MSELSITAVDDPPPKPPKKRIRVLFGWATLTFANPEIYRYSFGTRDCLVKELEISEVTGRVEGPAVPLGCWYLKLSQAKAAATKIWQQRTELCKQAVKDTRSTTAQTIGTM